MEAAMRFTQRVLSVVKKGSSRPITALDSDGNSVFIKLSGGLSSPTAAIGDAVCRAIGLALGLPILPTGRIIVDERADVSAVDAEVRDLIRKSYGINSASPYFPEAKDVEGEELLQLTSSSRTRLFIFDLITLNVDRSFSNTNILLIGDSEYSIDYEASFMIMGAIQAKDYGGSMAVRQALRQNPLYRAHLSDEMIERELVTLRTLDLASCIADVPDEWFGQDHKTVQSTKDRVCNSITRYISTTDRHLAFYHQLESVPYISEQERRQRNSINRNRFTASYSL
ncbi:MAG: HipA family kinase [Candidatus Kapaibacterium sp.]